MTIEDKIRKEKLQYNINREAAKISALLCGKIDKYEYLTSEEILTSDQRRVVEAKFSYFPLGKALDQGKKQTKQLTIMENNWLNLMHLLKSDYDT